MKKKKYESVLHDWVHKLPFQMQALLMTAMRGPDALPKHNNAKAIIRYLRGVVAKPAGDWRKKNDNDFMWGDYRIFTAYVGKFWADHDEYPHHFIMHLFHCAEVVGYKHPDAQMRNFWKGFYYVGCTQFHLRPETEKQMDNRLNDFGVGYHGKKLTH